MTNIFPERHCMSAWAMHKVGVHVHAMFYNTGWSGWRKKGLQKRYRQEDEREICGMASLAMYTDIFAKDVYCAHTSMLMSCWGHSLHSRSTPITVQLVRLTNLHAEIQTSSRDHNTVLLGSGLRCIQCGKKYSRHVHEWSPPKQSHQ